MIGNDFDCPIIYQDLANSTMGPMNMSFGSMGGFYPNTSYLGGVQMKPQSNADFVEIHHKKEEEGKKNFKKAMLVLGAIGTIVTGSILHKKIKKAGGLFKYLGNAWNKLTGKAPKKLSLWQKFKNIFKRKKTP